MRMKLNPKVSFTMLIFLILYSIFWFKLGGYYTRNVDEALKSKIIKTFQRECPRFDEAPKKEYLNEYTVKEGDTLLSISKEQLGDTSRVNEIIVNNEDRYPQLSFDEPFIEIGWRLYLPKSEYATDRGKIVKLYGRVIAKDNSSRWDIQSPIWGSTKVYVGNNQLPSEGVEIGDCISFVRAVGTQGWTIGKIELQP